MLTAMSSYRSRERWTVAALLVGLALGAVVFGFGIVGKFCVFATPALVAYRAFMDRKFVLIAFGRPELRQSSNPLGFWIAMLIVALIAAGTLWYFIEAIRPVIGI